MMFQRLLNFIKPIKFKVHISFLIPNSHVVFLSIPFQMLCEVETAILNLGHQLPSVHKSTVVTESSDWTTDGDLTLMLIQDWGVMRLYQAFLNDWTRAFRNATATGPGTCDPNAKKPLAFVTKNKSQKKLVSEKAKRPMKSRKPNGHIRKSTKLGSEGSILHGRRRDFRRRLVKNRRRKVL